MKRLIVVALALFFAAPAFADTWCEWSGTEGENCKNDRDGVLNMPFPTRTEAIINSHGYYRVVTTEPTLGADQVRDAEVWAKPDNTITKTWSVRDLTATELDQRIANPMSITDYYLWKALLVTGTITQQQAVAGLPAEMIDAYQARARLENP